MNITEITTLADRLDDILMMAEGNPRQLLVDAIHDIADQLRQEADRMDREMAAFLAKEFGQ